MEFTNEIFFNKNLVQGETVLITYSGKLFKEYSSEISIVYGFGDNWEHTSETKMQEKENGFEASIPMENFNTFNFCFKNNYNIWDNNFGFNYIATIEEEKENKTETSNDTSTDYKTETSTSETTNTYEAETVTDETENTYETETTTDESTNTYEGKNTTDNSTDTYKENTTNKSYNYDEIEQAFSDLLDSILEFDTSDDTEEVSLENGYGLQSFDSIEETEFTDCDKIFDDLYTELIEISDNNTQNEKTQNIQEAEQKTTETTTEASKNTDAQLEELLNGISVKEDEEQKSKILTIKELDNLMDNILNSIAEDDIKEEEQNEQVTETQDELGLTTVQEGDFLDRCIDTTASFFKVVWDGCKKLGILIKQKARELIGEENR